MAHYRFIVFCKPNESGIPAQTDLTELAKIDGYILGSEVFSFDTLRWMLPGMSEEKLHETFMKILRQKIADAGKNGLNAVCTIVEM